MKPKLLKTFFIFFIILSWILTGWPPIWQNPRIPPKIKEAQAAISFIGSAVGSSSPNTGTSVNISGIGIQSGDLIIVAAAVGDNVNNGLAAPTEGGYSRVPGVSSSLYADDTNDTNLDLYYKIANGTETTVSFGAVGGTNASNAAIVMVFRGVDNTTPFDTNANTATGIDTSNANPPSHDWSGTSGVWTVIAASTGHTGGASATFTFPTNYTTNSAQRAHNDTYDVLVGMGYRTGPSDPEDPSAFSAANIGTATNNSWAAVTMSIKPQVFTTTLGNGSDPSSSTVEPGTANIYLDQFTLQTNTGTDTVTALTVTTTNTSTITSMKICSNDANCNTQYFSTVSSPSGNNWNFSGGTSIPVSSSQTAFRVVFTAKGHSELSSGSYGVTGYVSSFTCTNSQVGSDSAGTTITIDNAPPSDATWGTITPGNQQVALNWSNPGSDFYKVLILRKAGSAVTDAPTEGTEYSAPGTIGSSTIIYVNNGTSFTDTGLTNGTNYYYKIFAYDQYKNYSSGVGTGPHIPFAPSISITVSDGTVSYGIIPKNTSKTTLSSDMPPSGDMQTVNYDTNVTVNINIKGYDASDGGCTWTLASSAGNNQYVHQFCNATDNSCTSPPTNYTALTTSYQTLKSGLSGQGTVNFHLRLTTPTESSCFGEQTVNVTIQATQ